MIWCFIGKKCVVFNIKDLIFYRISGRNFQFSAIHLSWGFRNKNSFFFFTSGIVLKAIMCGINIKFAKYCQNNLWKIFIDHTINGVTFTSAQRNWYDMESEKNKLFVLTPIFLKLKLFVKIVDVTVKTIALDNNNIWVVYSWQCQCNC